MPITLSSWDFNRDVARGKRAALSGPVLVTDRGRPTHVLLCRGSDHRGEQGRGGSMSGSCL